MVVPLIGSCYMHKLSDQQFWISRQWWHKKAWEVNGWTKYLVLLMRVSGSCHVPSFLFYQICITLQFFKLKTNLINKVEQPHPHWKKLERCHVFTLNEIKNTGIFDCNGTKICQFSCWELQNSNTKPVFMMVLQSLILTRYYHLRLCFCKMLWLLQT
jgi:hypothetical protein